MYCKKCGKENEDNALICKECGCSLVNEPTEVPKKKKSVWSLVGMGIGAAVVICGIIMIIFPDVSGVWIKSYSFGADFYTEIYNATSKVADSNITGEVVLSDSDGNVIISYTPAKEYNCVQISTAELEKGKTYTLKAGDTTTTIELNELLYSNISNNGNNGNKGRGGKSFPRTT